MAVIQRFKDNQRGAIVITGNTLGLSRQRYTQNPGDDNAINQFISTNKALTVPSAWTNIAKPALNENITFLWRQNSSSAILNMPPGSTVLHAELIWGGMSVSNSIPPNQPIDVSAYINTAITFTTPAGTSQVNPDPITSQIELYPGAGTFYVRTQNVTNLVSLGGSGTYTVGGVPSAININEVAQLNNAGWTLIVAYKNATLPPRNLNIYVCAELITPNATTNVDIDGFLTPPSGIINARILVGAQEGDATISGDQMLFGPDQNNLTALSGPNNPINNFFCSQINIGDPTNANVGQLDTSGSFGTRNADAINGSNIIAGRQGWDITNVDGSRTLINNQTRALIRMTTTGDYYVLSTVAIQIDTILVTTTKTVDKTIANPGDTLNYTVTITNESGVSQSVTFYDSTPTGTVFVPDSLDVDTEYTGNLESGIQLTDISSLESVTIRWKVKINDTDPIPNEINNKGRISITGLDDKDTNTVTTRVVSADVSIAKSVSPNPLIVGEIATYTISVENLGPDSAQNVVITDKIPSEIQNPEFSINNGLSWNAWGLSYNLGMLAIDESKSILIRGTLVDYNENYLTNTATVTSTTTDPKPQNNTVTIETPVSNSADISIVKSGPTPPIIAGEDIQYSLFIKNDGPSTSSNVVLTDKIPSDISSVEISVDGGMSWSKFVSPFKIGDLILKETRTILIRGNVSSSAMTDIVNTAVVSSDTPDPKMNNNKSTATTEVEMRADLSIKKTDNNNSPSLGDTLIYTIKIKNNGPSDALDVEVTDMLSSILINHEYSLDQINWFEWTGSYKFGTLVANLEKTIYLRGEVNEAGIIVNTATVGSNTFDPNLKNNTAIIKTEQQDAIITISKEADAAEVIAGNILTYTVVLSNPSSVDAVNVVLEDMLPDSIESPEYSLNSGVDWIEWNDIITIGMIPANTVRFEILIRGRILPSATGNILNTISGIATNAPPVSDNENTRIATSADIYITKTAQPEPIIAGQSILYTIKIGNNGPSDATNVVFSDVIPQNIINPKISYNFAELIPWESPYIFNIGTLPANAPEITIRILGTVSNSATENIINVATVDSDTFDPNKLNNIARFTSTVNTSANLSILKYAVFSPVTAGKEILYEITLNNKGLSDAQKVVVTDNLSSDILNPQYSLTGEAPWIDWVGTLSFDKVAYLETITFYIRGILRPQATGLILNHIMVESETFDPNLSDNESETLTAIKAFADIAVEKRVLTENPTAGLPILYQVIVKNNGPSVAKEIILSDFIASNILEAMYSIDGGNTWNEFTNSIRIEELELNEIFEVLISGMVSSSSVGSITNTAIALSTTPDPVPNNNVAGVITFPITLADLSVNKLSCSNPVSIGEYLVYSITVSNFGPSNAVQTRLVDRPPSYIDSPEFSVNNGATWNPWPGSGTLSVAVVGFQYSILIRGIVNESAIGNRITNTVTVSSQTKDPNLDNNTSSIISTLRNIVDLSITKKSCLDEIAGGDTIIYTIKINNDGPDIAEDVLITDIVPSSVKNVKYILNEYKDWKPWSGELNIGSLTPGSTITLKLRGTVSTCKDFIINTARVTTSSQDINLENNVTTVITPIRKQTDIIICQYSDICYICNCPYLYLWIIIKNHGPATAENVTIVDELPQNMKHATISLDNGKQWYPFTGCYYIGNLKPNKKKCLLIRGILSNSHQKDLYNIVKVYSSTILIGEHRSVMPISLLQK